MVGQAELESAIHTKLGDVQHLFVSDVSGGCGQAYDVVIVSDQFEGLSTLRRHRLVHSKLHDEISAMHAFSQKTYTPAQSAELKSKVAGASDGAAAPAPPAPAPSGGAADTAPWRAPSTPPRERAEAPPPRIAIPAAASAPAAPSPSSVSVPEVTLTPVSEMHPSLGSRPSPAPTSTSPVPTPPAPITYDTGISRAHYACISSPEFWLRVRDMLASELDGASESRHGVAPEAKYLFEDFFLSQKEHLTVDDIARIRDATGMSGMSA